jgi:hypothetical protein
MNVAAALTKKKYQQWKATHPKEPVLHFVLDALKCPLVFNDNFTEVSLMDEDGCISCTSRLPVWITKEMVG